LEFKSDSFALTGIKLVVWSPVDHLLAVGGLDGVWLYDADNPDAEPRQLSDGSKEVTSLMFAPDGRTLAAGLENGDIVLWSLVDDEQSHVLKDHVLPVRHLVFSPDGTKLASGGGETPSGYVYCLPDDYQDTDVRVWDTATGNLLARLAGLGEVRALSFGWDGNTVMAGTNEHCAGRDFMRGSVLYWDVQSGERLNVLKIRTPVIFSEGRNAVVHAFREVSVLQMLDVETADRVWEVNSDSNFFSDLQVDSSAGWMVAVAGHYNVIPCTGVQVWDTTMADAVLTLPACGPIELDPLGRFLITGRGELQEDSNWWGRYPSVDNVVRFWDLTDGSLVTTLDGGDDWASQIVSSPDGVFVAVVFRPTEFEHHMPAPDAVDSSELDPEKTRVEVWNVEALAAESGH
jgi:WD40 repeat protein